MSVTAREFWTLVHGMGLGAIFLLAFAGGLAGLWSLRPEFITEAGLRDRVRRLTWGTWMMALVAWLTVIVGTYTSYPWYRAKPPEGSAAAALVEKAKTAELTAAEKTELLQHPRYYLLSNEHTAGWHEFGMEWKEHVAWLSPILATCVAVIVTGYGTQLLREQKLRRALMLLFVLAFLAAAVAGLFGALITKAAPIL